MAANSNTNDTFRERYYTGNTAGQPSDGEIWIDANNTNRISVFRGGSWVTPRFDATTLTGTTTLVDASVGSTLTAQRVQVAGVASLSATNISGALSVTTQAAGASGKVVLGTAAVPTTPTSTSGILQISALPGTPVGQSAVPAAGTVFLTFDTTRSSLAINVAGSWFSMPSASLY